MHFSDSLRYFCLI